MLLPRTNQRPVALRSQSPTKRVSTDWKTWANTAGKSPEDQTPLSKISRGQQARKRQNRKVQVFESGEDSSQAVVLSSLAQ